jgi:DNA topoisomerase IB
MGFTYRWPDNTKVTEPDCLERIKALAVPPAWRDVWICPWPNGHIQAMGTDAAGRRQYRYHDAWRRQKDREKFARSLEFGRALPDLRRLVAADLAAPGLRKRRILATGVRLLDVGCFRIGGEEYAEDNETFGVATLQVRHVSFDNQKLIFKYDAKGSIPRTVIIEDPELRRVTMSLLRRSRRPKEDLLAWREGGEWRNLRSSDLNSYIKDGIGEQFSAKDFRTWSATVLAAAQFAGRVAQQNSDRQRRREILAAVTEVAEVLGNTPAVCRSAYIDPRVFDCFEAGQTVRAIRPPNNGDREEWRERLELAVIDLLSDEADTPADRRLVTAAA